MKNGLPGIRPGIHEQPVTILAQTQVVCLVSRDNHHPAQELCIICLDLVDRSDMAVGDDQQVHRCSGFPVFEDRDRIRPDRQCQQAVCPVTILQKIQLSSIFLI